MANNTTLNPMNGGDVIADENIAGVKYQQVKLIDPTTGSTTPIGNAANPMQVSLANTATNATPVKVDGSGVIQPISAASLPLPAGAATSTKQPALGTAGTPSSDVISVQGIASMTPLKVDNSGVTQPITGTVTANAGTGTFTVGQSTGTNLHTVVDSGDVTASTNADSTIGSTTAPAKQLLVGGKTSDATPQYQPLPLSNGGVAVKTDGSATTQPISASALPLPSGAATAANQSTANSNLSTIATNTGNIPAKGQATMANSTPVTLASDQSAIPVSGTFWQATQPVSGAVTANAGSGTFDVQLQDQATSGSLSATGSVTLASLEGANTAILVLTGTWAATVVFEGSLDGTTWFSLNGMPLPSGTLVTQTTANGQWQLDIAGLAQVRARVSSYTSGTVAIALRQGMGTGIVGLDSPLPAGSNLIGQVEVSDGTNTVSVDATSHGMHTMEQYAPGYEDNVADVAKVEMRYANFNISSATTTTIKLEAGYLDELIVVGGTMGNVTAYDNTAASGTLLLPTVTPVSGSILLKHVVFSTGLTIVTAAATVLTGGFR